MDLCVYHCRYGFRKRQCRKLLPKSKLVLSFFKCFFIIVSFSNGNNNLNLILIFVFIFWNITYFNCVTSFFNKKTIFSGSSSILKSYLVHGSVNFTLWKICNFEKNILKLLIYVFQCILQKLKHSFKIDEKQFFQQIRSFISSLISIFSLYYFQLHMIVIYKQKHSHEYLYPNFTLAQSFIKFDIKIYSNWPN